MGCPVHAISVPLALELLDAYVESGQAHAVLAANPAKVVGCQQDSELANILGNAALVIPDGIGVVYAIRWKYGHQIEQVCGVDLMAHVVAHAVKQGHSVFFLGAKEEVNRQVVNVFQQRYPALQVAGRANGYFDKDGEEVLIEQINASGARVLLVAMGSPQQEFWIARNLHRIKANWIQGVGGSFDVHSGAVRRAPHIVRRLHLEWFYRNFSSRSMVKRNKTVIQFSGILLKDALRNRRAGS
jgi:N-acetylglucosaminyldiphosphoundecaprenol N-acetyl-beta-D-mannosaminyltransferase